MEKAYDMKGHDAFINNCKLHVCKYFVELMCSFISMVGLGAHFLVLLSKFSVTLLHYSDDSNFTNVLSTCHGL